MLRVASLGLAAIAGPAAEEGLEMAVLEMLGLAMAVLTTVVLVAVVQMMDTRKAAGKHNVRQADTESLGVTMVVGMGVG